MEKTKQLIATLVLWTAALVFKHLAVMARDGSANEAGWVLLFVFFGFGAIVTSIGVLQEIFE